MSAEKIIAELADKARQLEQLKYQFQEEGDGFFLGYAVARWVGAIAARSFSAATLLEASDLDGALLFVRPIREKCVDLLLMLSWSPPGEAALRAHIFQRCRYLALADRNEEIGANPSLANLRHDFEGFKHNYPAIFDSVQRLNLLRDHWSGLNHDQRLQKTEMQHPVARKIQDLLSIEIHGSLDLVFKEARDEDSARATAQHIIGLIERVEPRVKRFAAAQGWKAISAA
jgi:hypothetical protein